MRRTRDHYNFAFLDEGSKREIRRCVLKAVAIPGYQVPFGSRELPIGRGWGTGGIQLTLSLIGKEDILKVIDQGSDESVNAVNIKKFVSLCTDVKTTTQTREATLIQTRHRIPEIPLHNEQILIVQVPLPEPLRRVEPREEITKIMHAEKEYAPIWLQLYESIIKYKKVTIPSEYPCMIEGRYMMNPSPIPKFDNPKLHKSECLYLFGAGREKKIYAVPPYTEAVSLAFEDIPFEKESFAGKQCHICGSKAAYLDEIFDSVTGELFYQCSDTSYCREVKLEHAQAKTCI
ncbi:MAG: alpha-D-ribose 1-methylphosphonate 5-phosphate C-P-lyase PhnJ [Peptococcaceae bacterium]|nr:alpha-D-ribose 1-methylphosphonate 5-phosphate C-P-lyase PhnJ [Peptococcaceae bacterium]